MQVLSCGQAIFLVKMRMSFHRTYCSVLYISFTILSSVYSALAVSSKKCGNYLQLCFLNAISCKIKIALIHITTFLLFKSIVELKVIQHFLISSSVSSALAESSAQLVVRSIIPLVYNPKH